MVGALLLLIPLISPKEGSKLNNDCCGSDVDMARLDELDDADTLLKNDKSNCPN